MKIVARCLAGAGLSLALSGEPAFAAPSQESESAATAADGLAAGGAPEAVVDLEGVEFQGSTVAPPLAALRWQGLILLHAADGVGLGGQLRLGNVGLRASVAYQPQYFIVDEDPWDDEFARFELTSSAQLNVDALYLFGESEKGASLSYRYSTLLGHGLGAAYQSYIDLGGARFALSIPVIYYPAASRRVRAELGLGGNERINFPFGPGLEYGVGIAWLF